jgi:hypothetical protein
MDICRRLVVIEDQVTRQSNLTRDLGDLLIHEPGVEAAERLEFLLVHSIEEVLETREVTLVVSFVINDNVVDFLVDKLVVRNLSVVVVYHVDVETLGRFETDIGVGILDIVKNLVHRLWILGSTIDSQCTEIFDDIRNIVGHRTFGTACPVVLDLYFKDAVLVQLRKLVGGTVFLGEGNTVFRAGVGLKNMFSDSTHD